MGSANASAPTKKKRKFSVPERVIVAPLPSTVMLLAIAGNPLKPYQSLLSMIRPGIV